jgi:hypothetical protein
MFFINDFAAAGGATAQCQSRRRKAIGFMVVK